MAIVFKTPGHIDHRSFTTFGINSKPNTSTPIGFFGTGLKYAIAGLIRLDCHVDVWIGSTRYHFYKKNIAFRDKRFDVIFMEKYQGLLKKLSAQELPYTTELGKTWEMWQFFRELEANTRDEDGTTFIGTYPSFQPTDTSYTCIVVHDPLARFDDCFRDRDSIFLDTDSMEVMHGDSTLTIYNRPSKNIYFRGMRVAPFSDQSRESPFTYNLTGWTELTEDRTLKYLFIAMHQIAESVIRSRSSKTIAAVLHEASKEGTFESLIPFDEVATSPSTEFQQILDSAKKVRQTGGSRLHTYWTGYTLRSSRPVPLEGEMTKEALLTEMARWREAWNRLPEGSDVQRCVNSAHRLLLLAYSCISEERYGTFTYMLEDVGQGKEKADDIQGEEGNAGASPVADSPIEKAHNGKVELPPPSSNVDDIVF